MTFVFVYNGTLSNNTYEMTCKIDNDNEALSSYSHTSIAQ